MTSSIFGQKTLIQTEYHKDSEQIKSQFRVLKSDTTIKHGEITFYKKINGTDYKYFQGKNHDRLIVAKGQFKDNQKVGLWRFFLNPMFYYDCERNKLHTFQLRHHYPLLAYEMGIQGRVVIQYDIDSVGQFKNLKGISGDSILMRGTIANFKKINVAEFENLKIIADIIEISNTKSLIDTINYRLE